MSGIEGINSQRTDKMRQNPTLSAARDSSTALLRQSSDLRDVMADYELQELIPGLRKYNMQRPKPRQTQYITRKDEVNKYDYFFEGQAYVYKSPEAPKKKKCGGQGHKKRRNYSQGGSGSLLDIIVKRRPRGTS